MKKLSINIIQLIILCILTFTTGVFSQVPNKTWLTDITSEVGLKEAKGSRVAFADINNDGYPDLIWGGDVGIIKNHVRIFLNVENPDKTSPHKRIFVDFTEESGISKSRIPGNPERIADISALADFNNDGYIDIVTSIYYHRLQMYADDPGDRTEIFLNDGTGRFTMVQNNGLHDFAFVDTLPRGLINCTGIAFLDYDYDGIIDIYFSTWFSDYAANLAGLGEYKMKDFLFKGRGDGTFVHVPNSGIERIEQPMYGVNVTDWNNDGWQDIITSPYCRSGGTLYRNNKNGTFTDVSSLASYSAQKMQGDHGQNLCQWEANPGDFNNDGYMDLLQVSVHGGYDDNEGRTTIAVNEGAANNYRLRWDINRIRREASKDSHLGDQGAQFFDLNGDGLLDIAIGQMGYPQANIYGQERLYICMQNDSGYFDDISRAVGVFDYKDAHSMEPADYDLDGDQDLFFSHQVRETVNIGGKDTTITYMRISLLRNDIGNKKTWTSVSLKANGETTNRSALGARIKVHSRSKTQMQEIQAGLGHFAGQQPFIRNFGLGDDNYIDSIVVRFPNKNLNTRTIVNPPLNLILEIDEAGNHNFMKTWEGREPVIAFDIPKIDFDTVLVGSYDERVFKIKNLGDANLVINALKINGLDKNHFEITSPLNLPTTIEPAKEFAITLRFTPNIRRIFESFIEISSNAVNKKDLYYNIWGFGFENKPIMEVTKDYIIMDSVWIDSTNTKSFDILNTGELPLVLNSISFKNDFAGVFKIDNLSLPLEVPAKSSASLFVHFTPKEIIHYETDIEIASNGYNKQSHTIKLYATCNGPFPKINVSRKLIIFGNVKVGQHKDMTFDIQNNGNANLVVSEASIQDDGSKFYQFLNFETPFILSPGKTEEVTLRFTPQEQKGYFYVAKLLSNSLIDSEITISLRGNGSEPDFVRNIYTGEDELSVSIAPNPAINDTRIIINLKSATPQDIQLILSDVCGCTTETVINKNITPGETIIPVNTSSFPSGKYHLVVFTKNKSYQTPLVIVR